MVLRILRSILLSLFQKTLIVTSISMINIKAYNFIYKKFERHPQVSDLYTNVNVGIGNGMGRANDPVSLGFLFLRYFGLPIANKDNFLLDLGCGDGTVLRIFQLLGYRKYLGVEFDPELCHLAAKNSKAQIIKGDFTHSELQTQIRKFSPTKIFAFNPINAGTLYSVIENLFVRSKIVVILRNPKDSHLLKSNSNFKVKILRKKGNYLIYELIKIV